MEKLMIQFHQAKLGYNMLIHENKYIIDIYLISSTADALRSFHLLDANANAKDSSARTLDIYKEVISKVI